MKREYDLFESGVTLIELMVTVMTVAIIIVVMPVSFRSSTGVWEKGDRHAEVMQNALIGMEEIARELKQAKSIEAVSASNNTNGYIRFENTNSDTASFKYKDQYLQHAAIYNTDDDLNPLSGPLTSLKFTCYEADDVTPTTDPEEIKSVLIQMDTKDEKGLVNDIPLCSKVYIGDLLKRRGAGDDYAIFGASYIYMKNKGTSGNADVFEYNTDTPANIGSNGDIYLRNGINIQGEVYYTGVLDFQNPAQQVFRGSKDDVYTDLPCPTDFSGFSYPDDPSADITVPSNQTYPPTGSLPHSTSSYRDVTLNNGSTLRLQSGQYYFRRFLATGNNCTVIFDLTSGTGHVEIFVEKEIRIGNGFEIVDSQIQGGTPENVYFETHYNNPDPAKPAVTMTKADTWIGTIYAVYDDIGYKSSTGGGSLLVDYGELRGSLYSGITPLASPSDIDNDGDLDYAYGGNAYIETNGKFYYVPSDYFTNLPYENCLMNDAED